VPAVKSLLIRLPQIEAQPERRLRSCPGCGGTVLQGWGRHGKAKATRARGRSQLAAATAWPAVGASATAGGWTSRARGEPRRPSRPSSGPWASPAMPPLPSEAGGGAPGHDRLA